MTKTKALQKWVRDLLIRLSTPKLSLDDVQSRSSGANGEDVILSPAARLQFPVSVECKNRNSFAVYKDYEQAQENNPDRTNYVTCLVIKQNGARPLVILDAEQFFMTLHVAKEALDG